MNHGSARAPVWFFCEESPNGKLLAVVLLLIATGSAIPILMHTWWMPEDISSHGYMIDKQMSETMAESGIAFVAAQLVLAGFVAMFGDKKNGRKATHLPGGAKAVVIAAIAFVGTEVLALGVFGKDAWARSTSRRLLLTPPSLSRSRLSSLVFIFVMPDRTENLVITSRQDR